MNNTEKMPLVLNLAKLVRFQQTSQARINPFYDASLYVFSHNDVNKATGKTFPKNNKQFTHEFSGPTHYCFLKFLFFSREWQARQTKATPEHNIWLSYLMFVIWLLDFGSDFEIRISDFLLYPPTPSPQPLDSLLTPLSADAIMA